MLEHRFQIVSIIANVQNEQFCSSKMSYRPILIAVV